MIKRVLTCLFISFLFISKMLAQTTGEKKGWPSIERYSFINSCITTAKEKMSEDTARFYCYCMQEKIELTYPTIELAGKITEADMESADWKKDIKSCLDGFWATTVRAAFLSNCISTAREGGMTEENSKSYCECMLFKVEKKFPNPLDAGKLTAKVLDTPEWKKIIQTCLNF